MTFGYPTNFRFGSRIGFPAGGAAFVAFDADAQAFFTAASITDDTQKTAVNDLVVALKADGIWAKCIAIYPFVGGTATTHKYNLKDPQDTDGAYRIVWGGTVTHNANGITGDGSTGHGDTKIVPSAALTLNDTHLSIYSRSIPSGSDDDIGCQNTPDAFQMSCRSSGSFIAMMYRNDTTDAWVTLSNSDGSGFFVASRRSSTDMEAYRNGSSIGTQTLTNTGSLPTVYPIYVGAINGSGTVSGASAKNIAFASIGSGLTNTEAANFTTAVEAFQDALSRGVVA